MTKLDERISLELEQDLMNLFTESLACEVDAHDEQPHFHEGDGDWYITVGACKHCGSDAGVTLICEKFKETVEQSLHTGSVPCSACKKRNRLSDIFVSFDKRSNVP